METKQATSDKTSDKPELKPCPFCGGEVEIVRVGGGWFWKHIGVFETWDADCPIQFNRKYDTKEEAIEAWNRRAAYAD